LQALDAVPTRHFEDAVQAVRTLRSEGYTIAVLETTYLSQKYTNVSYPKKVALVLGNEVIGVDTRIVDMADMVLEIPTFGVKNSLNVASAASIVMFEVLRQWNTDGAP
jgi:tRNA G18 (ribose-2'-O)-methylase SpoU